MARGAFTYSTASQDSLGTGIPGAYIGGRKVYHINDVIAWFDEKAEEVQENKMIDPKALKAL